MILKYNCVNYYTIIIINNGVIVIEMVRVHDGKKLKSFMGGPRCRVFYTRASRAAARRWRLAVRSAFFSAWNGYCSER